MAKNKKAKKTKDVIEGLPAEGVQIVAPGNTPSPPADGKSNIPAVVFANLVRETHDYLMGAGWKIVDDGDPGFAVEKTDKVKIVVSDEAGSLYSVTLKRK